MKTPGITPRIGMLLLATLLVTVAPPALALDPNKRMSQYMLERWGRNEGLPTTVIWDIMQDKSGYLWLATQNGLVRFDGVRFVNHHSGTEPAFTANDIRSVFQDSDGTLWIGTYGGGVVRHDGDGFTRIGTADGLAHGVVYKIFEASDGALWFATGGGVTRLEGGEFRSWTPEDGLAHARVFDISEHPDGTMWFGTLSGGLSRFDGEHFRTFDAKNGLDSDQMHMVYRDRADRMWVSTYAGGVYHIVDGVPEPAPVMQQLPDGFIVQTATEDRDGNLWLGSYGGGLLRITDGVVERFNEKDLSEPAIFTLHEDREGNMWVGSYDGLFQLRDGKFRLLGEPEGLANSTYVVYEDPNEDVLWVGTEGHGLFRYDGNSITQYTDEDGLASNSVSALSGDADGTLWVGTFGGGLHRFDPDAGVTAHYDMEDGLPSNQVLAVIRRSDGTLWVSADGGISMMQEDGFRTWTVADGLPDSLTRVMHEDRHGDFWLGTNAGLTRMRNGEFETWTVADGLAANLVISIHEDEDGVLWIGSRSQGLSRFEDGEIFAYTNLHGLPQLSVLRILEDTAGNFWMSGSNGLARVTRASLDAVAAGEAETLDAELLTEHDGLRSSQFTSGFQPNGWQTRAGMFWFPTLRGLAGIDPANLEHNPHPPPVYIEEVRVNGLPVPVTGRLEIDPGEGNLEIDYTGISLTAPDAVRFRYRLDGVDPDWQDAGSRRTAFYTGLPSGDHRFRVLAANNDGVWNESGATLEIHRKPYFYQTNWFFMLAVLIIGLLGYAIYALALHRARTRESELEALVQERTAQLEQALQKVEKISREDGLTGLANRRCFEEVLQQEWARAMREQKPVSILMMDLDHFKPLNDNQGHQVGDECLIQVARVLDDGVNRSTDLVARYGGEEFVLLLPDTDAQTAVQVAERLRRQVAALELPHPDGGIDDIVTISAGTATTTPARHEEPGPLIVRADDALYQAKHAGRNRVVRG